MRLIHHMKKFAAKKLLGFGLLTLTTLAACRLFALSLELPQPSIHFPQGYDTNRASQVLSVLRSDQWHYLGGLTSYWPPEYATTLAYGGDTGTLLALLTGLNRIGGISVRLTFSPDLSRETGSALQAGSWWVIYSHSMPDTITIRVNLAAEELGGEHFALVLPKPDL